MGTCKTKAIQADLSIFTHIPANYGIYSLIQAYPAQSEIFRNYSSVWSDIFRTLCNPGLFRTLVYSETWYCDTWYIQNPGIFRNLVLRHLVYSEPWHIQKPSIATPAIFRTLAYLELCQTSRTAIIIFAKSNHLHNFSSSGTLLYEINIMNYFNSGQFILQKNLFYVK